MRLASSIGRGQPDRPRRPALRRAPERCGCESRKSAFDCLGSRRASPPEPKPPGHLASRAGNGLHLDSGPLLRMQSGRTRVDGPETAGAAPGWGRGALSSASWSWPLPWRPWAAPSGPPAERASGSTPPRKQRLPNATIGRCGDAAHTTSSTALKHLGTTQLSASSASASSCRARNRRLMPSRMQGRRTGRADGSASD